MKTCDSEGDGWNTRLECSNERLEMRWSNVDELDNRASVNGLKHPVKISPCIHSERPLLRTVDGRLKELS